MYADRATSRAQRAFMACLKGMHACLHARAGSWHLNLYKGNRAWCRTGAGGDIDLLILIDREVDLVTPLCTQLTYEGLIDEALGIRNGIVQLEHAGFLTHPSHNARSFAQLLLVSS